MTVSFPKIGQTAIQNKNFTRKYMQRHTVTETVNYSRSTAWERSVKYYLGWEVGGGLNRFYMVTTLALSSAVAYTRRLFSPREGFLTHQYNISVNIKIKRIQRWNNDEDSTARNNWNTETKESQQLDSGGPDQSQSIRHQPTLKSLQAEAVIESEARPACVQPNREAKLLTVTWLTTMHAVCCITFILYPIFIYGRQILRNWVQKSLQAYIFFWIYILSYHKIQVPTGRVAKDV